MSPPPDQAEAEEADERQSPSSRVVHEAILAEGLEELDRPSSALFWSAIAAGLSMGFSLIAQVALRSQLPDAAWQPLVVKLGYSIGFLIVILGRQQLFTENTLTPILPLLDRRPGVSIGKVLRLWGVVLMGNLVGALVIALALQHTAILSAEFKTAVGEIGREALDPGFAVVLLRGIVAGWLIALIVWLLPAAETAHVWVILVITWLIGVGHFSHVVAGSIDVFALASTGEVTWMQAITSFTLPSLIGNILGGVTLVGCLNHAQARAGHD
jgi:formate/nitrite transporter FocA (FNT family)